MLKRYLKFEGFINIPLSGGRFTIDIHGIIKNKQGEIIQTTKDINDELIVFCDLYSGVKWYKVGVLVAMIFKASHYPLQYWDLLNVLYLDGNKDNVHASNLIWKHPTGGLKHPFYIDYNIIPGASNYGISKEGDVIHLPSGKGRKTTASKSGYFRNCITPDVGEYGMFYSHRLMAFAWIDYPANVSDLFVNHIKGKQAGNSPDNLEWVTMQENNEHAYATGLILATVPVLIKNVLTGEITRYRSVCNAANSLNIRHAVIQKRLLRPNQPVWKDYTQVKREDDPTPWREITNVKDEINSHPYPREILAYNIFTKEITKFCTIAEACRQLNICDRSVRTKLIKTNTQLYGYCFRFANNDGTDDSLEFWPKFTNDEIEKFKDLIINRKSNTLI